ncbi:hypothetical protein [Marisediminicola senii]|uniref:hypothetical protein n=1 Tax=Marisediminicola senii TaxID=2711233 RepID=UPI0013ED0BA0|nr:hypothetical protein [Marisediminicola senii]
MTDPTDTPTPWSPGDRRAELVAAAVAGDLTPAERAELDALAAADASVVDEIEGMRAAVAMAAASIGRWDSSAPSGALADRIAAIAGSTGNEPVPDITPATRRFRPASMVLGAAACVALGAGVVLGAQAIQPGPPSGPPGTLGAVESVDFTGEPGGVAIDGSVIAHTWGTETVLEIDGLPAGDSYSVVLVGDDGVESPSGTFFGSEVTIDCRMNAAVMRDDVSALEIRDDSGDAVAVAMLPAAQS